MTFSTESRQLNFSEVVQTIDKLVQSGKTGTIYLLTDQKRYARLGLKQGRIAQLVFGKHRGEDALTYIQHIDSAIYSFADGVVSGSGELPLPPTRSIIQWLYDCAFAKQGLGPTTQIPLPTAEIAAADLAVEPSEPPSAEIADLLEQAPLEEDAQELDLDEEPAPAGSLGLQGNALFETVTRELATYLGPIAPMIVHDYRSGLIAARTSEDVYQLVSDIGEQIGDENRAVDFISRIMQRVSP